MADAVVDFVIADGDDIRLQQIDQLDRRDPLVIMIDQRAFEQIARDHVETVFFFLPYLREFSRKKTDTAAGLPVFLFGIECAMRIIGMKDRELSDFCHYLTVCVRKPGSA